MRTLDEEAFVDTATRFIAELRGPEHGGIDPDWNLVTEAGLDSLQLIAVLRFIEQLRDDELLDFPELGGLTLRTAYRLLYLGQPASDEE